MRLFFFLMIRRPPRSTLFPYAPLSRSLSSSVGGKEPTQPPKSPRQRSSEGKIGRNDPCPCGSGKKYKKCGIPNTPEHQRLMASGGAAAAAAGGAAGAAAGGGGGGGGGSGHRAFRPQPGAGGGGGGV